MTPAPGSPPPDDAALLARIEDLVDRCLDAEDPIAELETHAGDEPEVYEPALRVLRRVAAHEDIGSGGPVAVADPTPERIGQYRIVRRIGAGAMGVVYLAEQDAPIHRSVAMKIVRAELMAGDAISRFEAERQALARMNHASIARIFDAGTTESGQPFVVMEHIDGIALTDYCDTRRLSLRQRLQLFIEVCAGIQHAHQKGVIHRDIKPQNILIAEIDGQAVPKIIDFGLARAIEGPHSKLRGALQTKHGQMLGTPVYMSPEQASGSQDIDTRSDVYSLGAILYELCCGLPPFAPGELEGSTIAEVRRRLCEEEPPSPSERVAEAAALARGCGVTELRGKLQDELDWVALRALAKEPADRYPTPLELAAEIERFLADAPVLAGRPSARMRLRKFVRRHRGRVFAGIALVGTLTAGFATTAWFYAESEQQRTIADARNREFDLLANLVRLERAKAAYRELGPPSAATAAAIDAWLAIHGEPLRDARAEVTKAITDLRARGTAPDPTTREAKLARIPAHVEAERLDSFLDYLHEHLAIANGEVEGKTSRWSSEYVEKQIARLEASRDAQRAAVDERSLLDFDNPADAFLLDTLTRSDRDLSTFEDDWLRDAKARRRWSAAVESITVIAHADRWDEARTAIAAADDVRASRLYAEQPIDLAPQLGLIPIGANPVTKLWEFYHPGSGAPGAPVPTHDANGDVTATVDSGIVFILVPGGTFTMGASDDPTATTYDPHASRREMPAHPVTLHPFFIARHETTQAQWSRLCPPFHNRNPSGYFPRGDSPDGTPQITLDNPVERVAPTTIDDVLRWNGLVLPSEAQWEYAARAGTTTPWWTGADPASLEGAANVGIVEDGRPDTEARDTDGFDLHCSAHSMRANPFGLHHVHGNVWEWCADTFVTSYRVPTLTDGSGLRDVDTRYLWGSRNRVMRGGSFYYAAPMARSTTRIEQTRTMAEGSAGFRAAYPLRGAR